MVSRVPGSSGQSSRFPPLLQKLTVQVYNPIICPASSSTPVKRGSDCSTWYPHQHANGGSSMVLSCGTAHWSSSFRLQHAFIDHMGKCELTSVYPSTKVALAGGIFQVLPLNTCRVLQSTVWLFFFFFLIESAHLAYTRHVSVSPWHCHVLQYDQRCTLRSANFVQSTAKCAKYGKVRNFERHLTQSVENALNDLKFWQGLEKFIRNLNM